MGRVELIEYLFKLSEGKLFLINQLWTLTQQQSETIDSGEMDSLNDIIEQKQSIMDRVDVLDKEFAEKYDSFYNKYCYLEDGGASKRAVRKIFFGEA